MRAKIIEGYKKGSKIYYCGDGYYFHRNRRKNGKVYLRCNYYYNIHCCGRAMCNEDGSEFENTNRHIWHPKSKYLPETRELRKKILKKCASRNPTRFSSIVWQCSQGYSRTARSKNTAVGLRSAMRRARLNFLPDIPKSMSNAHDILANNPHVHRIINGNTFMYAGRCGSSKNKDLCLIFISEMMKKEMANAKTVFADGTKDGTPAVPGCNQTYSITTTINNQIIPLCIVLMQRKSEKSYTRVLTSIRQLVPGFSPSIVHTDFETGQYNAWAKVFPEARREACLFHYAKNVSEKAQKLGYSERMQDNATFKSIVRSALAIPMVPADYLHVALESLMLRAFYENMFEELEPFFEYLHNEWVTKRRDVLSVFKAKDRTNNVGESWNAKFQEILVEKSPNIYQFIDGLLRLEEEARQNLFNLRRAIPTCRPRKTSALRNDSAIKRLTDLWQNGTISMESFLRRASYRMRAPFQKLFPGGDDDDDDGSDVEGDN